MSENIENVPSALTLMRMEWFREMLPKASIRFGEVEGGGIVSMYRKAQPLLDEWTVSISWLEKASIEEFLTIVEHERSHYEARLAKYGYADLADVSEIVINRRSDGSALHPVH